MARTVIEQISDDLDGSANASPVSFSYDGTEYTIDLSPKNKTAFDKLMKPYLAAATKVSPRSTGSRRRSRATTASSGRRDDLNAIREWAGANGYEVSSRGRIRQDVVAAYDAAH